MVQLRTSEIGEDIAWYLLEAEQDPSCITINAMAISNGQVTVAGLLIQPLPGAGEAALAVIENIAANQLFCSAETA